MFRTLSTGIFVFSFLAILSMGNSCPAQADEAAFVSGLKRVTRSMADRKWSRALDRLKSLLAEHEGQDHARLRRAEIVEIDRRCRFHTGAPEVDPNDLISGEILSCNLSSGKIDVRYTPQTLKDFHKAKELRYHPVTFAGPYKIEVKGKSYPECLRNSYGKTICPQIFVCLTEKQGYLITFGLEQSSSGAVDRWLPASIYDVATKKKVAEKEMTLARSGKPFRLKVKVDARQITAYCNNKVLLKTRKPADLFGGWGYAEIEEFEEIRVTGKAEPAWLQGLVDAAMQERQAVFAKTYDPQKTLPGWLFEEAKPAAGAVAARADRRRLKPFPGAEPTTAETQAIARVLRYAMNGESEKCRKYLDRLQEANALSEVKLAFLYGTCHAFAGDYEQAFPHLKRMCELDPDFLLGYQLLITAAIECGRESDVLKEFRDLLAAKPRSEYLQCAYIECLIRTGRFEEARLAQARAVQAGLRSSEIEQLGRTATQALHGPNWARVHEHRSAHYVVRSDIDLETCKRAAQLLEDAYRAYNVHLKRARKTGERFTVYLFSGQAGFHAYCEAALGDRGTHAAGLYSPTLRQLLIWNAPERDIMMQVVRHEGSHQYMHALCGRVPTWFDEGLAEYHETADYQNGKWQVGRVRSDHLEALDAGRHVLPLKQFFQMPPRSFYEGKTARNYGQAWAFVYFLRHGPRTYRPLIDKLLEGLKGSEPARRVVERVFKDVNLDVMDQVFIRYVKGLSSQVEAPAR